MNILLLGGSLQGLSCGASLKRCGHIVDAISDELQIKKSSFFRHVYGEFPLKIEYLCSILDKQDYDIIIPMGDLKVTFLSNNKNKIEKDYNVICATPDIEKLSIVEDKHVFMQFCEENRIPHPITAVINKSQLEYCAHKVGFPSLIKPDYSVGARGITRVNSLNDLKEAFPVVSEQFGACTLQELIENEEYYYNVILYRAKNGEFLAHSISKIIRMYPIHAGSSSCLVTVEDNELLNICKDCLDKLDWVGIADFDVLQRLDNLQYKIIELNARVPASLRSADISGVNFPEIIVQDSTNNTVPQYVYNPGKVLRYLGIDILWILKSSCRFKSKPNWFKFWGKNLYYQDIYRNDTSTWYTWLIEGLLKLKLKNKRLR